MMAPECPLENASGLIMVKVRLLIVPVFRPANVIHCCQEHLLGHWDLILQLCSRFIYGAHRRIISITEPSEESGHHHAPEAGCRRNGFLPGSLSFPPGAWPRAIRYLPHQLGRMAEVDARRR